MAAPEAAATAAAVLAAEHWPDYASELGRVTPMRRGGLAGQTFEIEVVGFPSARTPVFTRGYVTITTLVTGYVAEPAIADLLAPGLTRLGLPGGAATGLALRGPGRQAEACRTQAKAYFTGGEAGAAGGERAVDTAIAQIERQFGKGIEALKFYRHECI